MNRKRSRPSLSPRDRLEILYHRLGGKGWTQQKHWLSKDHDISDWYGVTCRAQTGEITVLELSQNKLCGRLDDEEVLEALPSSLEQLWLSENQLTGNIPVALADQSAFPHLSILDLGSNQLTGSLHPLFARAKHFSWFEISGNQLTSYFRFEKGTAITVSKPNQSFAEKLSCPKPLVHILESALTEVQSRELVDLAIAYTQQQPGAGWQTDRHRDYRTTDVDIAIVGGRLLDLCNKYLKDTIFPCLSYIFDIPLYDFAMEDLFLAKYSDDDQRSLPKHKDDSELSFVITLNKGFEGGGTIFHNYNLSIAPTTPGTAVLFCGRLAHAGLEVTKGTRYILAGFVRVYPSSPQTSQKLEGILEQAQSEEKNM